MIRCLIRLRLSGSMPRKLAMYFCGSRKNKSGCVAKRFLKRASGLSADKDIAISVARCATCSAIRRPKLSNLEDCLYKRTKSSFLIMIAVVSSIACKLILPGFTSLKLVKSVTQFLSTEISQVFSMPSFTWKCRIVPAAMKATKLQMLLCFRRSWFLRSTLTSTTSSSRLSSEVENGKTSRKYFLRSWSIIGSGCAAAGCYLPKVSKSTSNHSVNINHLRAMPGKRALQPLKLW